MKQHGSKRCHVQDLEEGFLEVASLTVAAWVGAWFADAKGWVRGWDLEGGNVDWASVKVGVRAVANDCTLLVDGCKAVLLHQRLRAIGVVCKPPVVDLLNWEVPFKVPVFRSDLPYTKIANPNKIQRTRVSNFPFSQKKRRRNLNGKIRALREREAILVEIYKGVSGGWQVEVGCSCSEIFK